MGGVPIFPDQASTVAPQVDRLYFALIATSGVFTLAIFGLVLFFSARYWHGVAANRRRGSFSGLKIELPIIGFMVVLALGTFVWAAIVYFQVERPPADAVEMYVVGKQWMWKMQHPEGQREINQLHVPVGRTVKLMMTSEDVIHSFYVPAFRIKQDVLPGRYTTIWFEATKAGDYAINCAEYCGTDHAKMGGVVIAMDPAQYEAWLSGGSAAAGPQTPESMAAAGERLFTGLGCSGCHRMDGSGVAPSLVGVYGKPVQLEGGQTATVDEGYIRDSILLPQSQVVAGYQPIMPSFKGQVSEEQILDLIAYIKSLASTQGTQSGPQNPATQQSPGGTATSATATAP
jgi:cytochrome c oxidase subunit 2